MPRSVTRVAAVDAVTGHAAYSFLRFLCDDPSAHDPWAEECFTGLVDLSIIYPRLVHPLPNARAALTPMALPPLLVAFVDRGLIHPHIDRVADSVEVDASVLEEALDDFERAARTNPQDLMGLIDFHFQADKKAYRDAAFGPGRSVQPFIEDFWHSSSRAHDLAHTLGGPGETMWAFDVFLRGRQYDEILRSANAVYFPHPFRRRSSLAGARPQHVYRADRVWSWGRLLANLMREGELPPNLEEVCDRILAIRAEIDLEMKRPPSGRRSGGRRSAPLGSVPDDSADNTAIADESWFTLARNADLNERIAYRLGLPAKITKNIVDDIDKIANNWAAPTAVGMVSAQKFGSDAAGMIGGAITVTVMRAISRLNLENRWVRPSRFMRRLTFLRGSLEWPAFEKKLTNAKSSLRNPKL